MTHEAFKKSLNKNVYKTLFHCGFFKRNLDLEIATTNLSKLIEAFNKNKNLYGETLSNFEMMFDLFLEKINKLKASKERSFEALTLT